MNLVKKCMQKQCTAIYYCTSLDCAFQMLRGKGLIGLYCSLPPYLLGIAPEKAIKLSVNNLLQESFSSSFTSNANSELALPLLVLAGGATTACLVLVTNLFKIIKI